MKHNKKENNGIYSFLDATGILEQGTDEAIKEAKKKYWSEYKKEWNKAKRQECKSFEILLNQNELKTIITKAERHHTSPTNYIKTSALTNKQVIDLITIGEIRELLIMYNNTLQSLTEEKILPTHLGNQLIEQITQIEKRVLDFFSSLK